MKVAHYKAGKLSADCAHCGESPPCIQGPTTQGRTPPISRHSQISPTSTPARRLLLLWHLATSRRATTARPGGLGAAHAPARRPRPASSRSRGLHLRQRAAARPPFARRGRTSEKRPKGDLRGTKITTRSAARQAAARPPRAARRRSPWPALEGLRRPAAVGPRGQQRLGRRRLDAPSGAVKSLGRGAGGGEGTPRDPGDSVAAFEAAASGAPSCSSIAMNPMLGSGRLGRRDGSGRLGTGRLGTARDGSGNRVCGASRHVQNVQKVYRRRTEGVQKVYRRCTEGVQKECTEGCAES